MESRGGCLCESGTCEVSRQEFCEGKMNELSLIHLRRLDQHDVERLYVEMPNPDDGMQRARGRLGG